MSSLAELTLDLFLLGHAHLAAGQAGEGFAFERRVRRHLDVSGFVDSRGFRVFGRRSLSGLYHQIDEQTACVNAVVVGEWKAYRGTVPKNDLLRFKAVTDDYWLADPRPTSTRVVRVFGGTGAVTDSMRVYAAHWGIILVTPDRWPIPALTDPSLLWSDWDRQGPTSIDRRTLATLIQPMDRILAPQQDGTWKLPGMATAADIAARISVWEHWSERAWRWWDDSDHTRFDDLMADRLHHQLDAVA